MTPLRGTARLGRDTCAHAHGQHSPAFTLATYVHLLPDDLPEPDFLDALDVSETSDAEQRSMDKQHEVPRG